MKKLLLLIGILLCGLLFSSPVAGAADAGAGDRASEAKFYPAEWTDWDWRDSQPPAAYYSWHSERSACIEVVNHEGCDDANNLCGIFSMSPLPDTDVWLRLEERMQDLGFGIDLIVCPDQRKLPPGALHAFNLWLYVAWGSRQLPEECVDWGWPGMISLPDGTIGWRLTPDIRCPMGRSAGD